MSSPAAPRPFALAPTTSTSVFMPARSAGCATGFTVEVQLQLGVQQRLDDDDVGALAGRGDDSAGRAKGGPASAADTVARGPRPLRAADAGMQPEGSESHRGVPRTCDGSQSVRHDRAVAARIGAAGQPARRRIAAGCPGRRRRRGRSRRGRRACSRAPSSASTRRGRDTRLDGECRPRCRARRSAARRWPPGCPCWKSIRFDTSSVIVETMRAAPGVPRAATSCPSFSTIVGAIVVRIRLPGAIALTPRDEKFFTSLLRMMPVPGHHHLRAEEVGDGLRDHDGVALRRRRPPATSCWGSPWRRPACRPSRRAVMASSRMSAARACAYARRREPGDGHRDEVGIGDERAVVGERALQRLGGQVDARGDSGPSAAHVELLEDLQGLDERDAGDRRRRRHDVVPAVAPAHRLPLDGAVARRGRSRDRTRRPRPCRRRCARRSSPR